MARGAFEMIEEEKPVAKSAPAPRTGATPDPVAALESMVGKPMPAPPKKGKMELGKPGKPVGGQTIHQLMRDRATLKQLAEEIERWEADNPKRKLKGPTIKDILGDKVSQAQAGRIAKMINKQKMKLAGMGNHVGRGAAKALKG